MIVIAMNIIFILYKYNSPSYSIILSSILILLASLINASLGFIQFQIGVSKNGVKSFLLMIFSIFLSLGMIYLIEIEFIALSLLFFSFHLVSHVSNYIITLNWLKKC